MLENGLDGVDKFEELYNFFSDANSLERNFGSAFGLSVFFKKIAGILDNILNGFRFGLIFSIVKVDSDVAQRGRFSD